MQRLATWSRQGSEGESAGGEVGSGRVGGLKVSKPDKVHSHQNTAFCRAYAKVQNIPGKEWPGFLWFQALADG